MKIIFVYGTLKKGEFNHFMLKKDSKFVGNCEIDGYTLYDTGRGYPAAVKSENDKIEGELYEVSEENFERITRMELGANYTIDVVDKKDSLVFLFWMRKIYITNRMKQIGSLWEGKKI
jgi:gamma-glutamylcyclotransferase (GGCT)/AIG2-like uncharacterized protein YtfP